MKFEVYFVSLAWPLVLSLHCHNSQWQRLEGFPNESATSNGSQYCYDPINASLRVEFSVETLKKLGTNITVTLKTTDKLKCGWKRVHLDATDPSKIFSSSYEHVPSGNYTFFLESKDGSVHKQMKSDEFSVSTNQTVRMDFENWNPAIDVPPNTEKTTNIVINLNQTDEFRFTNFKLEVNSPNGTATHGIAAGQLKVSFVIPALEPGDHRLIVTPIDDRCWSVKCGCSRYLLVNIPEKDPVDKLAGSSGNGNLIAISIAVTCSVALLTACAIWLFFERGRRFLRRNFEMRPTVPYTRPESPSAILNKMPEVLLVYDFNDEIVSAKVSLLRNELTECGAPQVHDYGDETQFDSRATEGADWFPNRIMKNDVKIIIIHSVGLVGVKNEMDGGDVLPNQILRHALNLIQLYGVKNPSKKYTRIYQIRFADLVPSVGTESLGPDLGVSFTLFTLPNDMQLLINELRGAE